MCYRLKDENLIHIEGKTKEYKYQFLKSYIPLWNEINCGRGKRERVIIDTHAGTGKVLLNSKKIFGSSLIFLKETSLKQEGLNFYFIEIDFKNYYSLRRNINDVCKLGIHFPQNGSSLKRVIKDNLPFEISSNLYKSVCPKREQIKALQGDASKMIDHVLKEIEGKPAFFFIDPCGKLEWKLIQKIINARMADENGDVIVDKKGKNIQGTELFINYSWEAILRNGLDGRDEAYRNRFFKKVYDMTLDEIKKQKVKIREKMLNSRRRFYLYHIYAEIYKNKLRKYFNHVSELSIPGIKSEKNPVYLMIYCTNNEKAWQLYQDEEAKLNKVKNQYVYFKKLAKNKRNYTYKHFKEHINGQKTLDEFDIKNQ
jgi:three-Cys-motif partner protein